MRKLGKYQVFVPTSYQKCWYVRLFVVFLDSIYLPVCALVYLFFYFLQFRTGNILTVHVLVLMLTEYSQKKCAS